MIAILWAVAVVAIAAVSITGSEAGNLALKVLAVGGVYLAGGIAVHLQPVLKSSFRRSFWHKGRFAELMGRIPVHLMTGKVGIAGAAAYGIRKALEARPRPGLDVPVSGGWILVPRKDFEYYF